MAKSDCFLCKSTENQAICQHCGASGCVKDDHLQFHRQLNICFPFEVDFEETKGRIMKATRDVKEGELVLVDSAVALIPNEAKVCMGCFKALNKDQICSKCSLPVCNEGCENSKWHLDYECKVFQNQTKLVDMLTSGGLCGQVLTLVKVLLAQKANKEVTPLLKKLISHNDSRLKDEKLVLALKQITAFIQNHLEIDVTFDDVSSLFGMVETNAMGLKGLDGRGIYPIASIISHSCVRNLITVIGPGEVVAFKANRKILKGEELTISYIPVINSRINRRQELYEKWKFWCQCSLCIDPEEQGTFISSPTCMKCDAKGQMIQKDPSIPSNDWHCINCNGTMPYSQVLEMEKALGNSIKSIEKGQKPVLEFIKKIEETFSQNHHQLIKLKFNYLMEPLENVEEDLKTRVKFCQDLLPTIDKVGEVIAKGKIAEVLSKAKIKLLAFDLKAGKIDKTEYLKLTKQYICLQMEAGRIKKTFGQ